MSNIIPFDFEENPVRVVSIDDAPWFLLADVCRVLDLSNPSKAASQLDDDDRTTLTFSEGGPARNVINESGLYSLIIRSNKPDAKRFKRWITSQVLPSIRKNGGYIADQESEQDPSIIIARALQVANNVIEQHQRQLREANNTITQQQPKVEFYDQVAGSKDAIDIGRAAKVLNIKGLGRNKLFDFLRQEKILQPDNMPYQQHIDAGRFRVVESKFKMPDGETRISMKTLVYQRGLDYIRRRYQRIEGVMS